MASLLRLALRRDRIRLGVWISVLTLTMVYAPNAIKLAYPEEAQRLARVNLLRTPAGMMLGGPMFGGKETDLGAMMANELMLTLIVAASIMSILTVIRHTRAEEESGAAELVLSSVVGRYARTTAALILVGGANAILAVTMTLAMSATGLRGGRHRRHVPGRHRGFDGVRRCRGGHRAAVATGAHRDRRRDGGAGAGRAGAWNR